MTPQQLLTEEAENLEQVTELDISHLVIEDDTPVDNFQSEEQQRLLVEPLYSSQALPRPFLAAANVGLFYELKGDPIVPDIMLSLGVQRAADYSQRQNRSYFVWEFGKVPEVCIEIVSNQEGDELLLSKQSQRKGKIRTKLDTYAQIKIPYYVVFDPLQQIQGKEGMNGALLRVWTISPVGYTELTLNRQIINAGESVWLEGVGLGVMLWEGEFEEDVSRLWLRWCDQEGKPIPTGAEGREIERQRADTQQQQAQIERQRAEMERQQAEMERQRAERLAQKLREMGIDPDQV
ncbi:MAG: Uma2 family endonuclease [Symploca sp. SIO3E6]|nr:Uma2 family endonuclease [Caldora sp. SIO3E6]